MPDAEVLKKSVTAADYPTTPSSGILHFLVSPSYGQGGNVDLPPFWSAGRDAVLSGTIFRESIWAGALKVAISKRTTKDWTVDSDIPIRAKRAQQLFLDIDGGRGWTYGLSKVLQAFLTTGNGAIIEIVRATGAAGSRILGLVPLDPLRVTRTGNSNAPYLYRDRQGREHELKDYQAFDIVDTPDPGELYFGVGHCAAERAYKKILTLEAIENYYQEKITGRRPMSIYMVNMRPDQIDAALKTAQADADSKGLHYFMGSAIAGLIDPAFTPAIAEIPLASLPDGFDAVAERREGRIVYAAAIGIDPQDLDPGLLGGGALGTGAQSRVLVEKAKGQGLAEFDKAWIHAVQQYALDDVTTFYFQERDLNDELMRAQITTARANAYGVMADKGFITSPQGTQMLVDDEEVPSEFLPTDQTPDDDLTDTEKPEGEEEAQAQPAPDIVPPEETAGKAAKKKLRKAADIFERVKGDIADLLTLAGTRKAVRTDGLPKILGGLIEMLTDAIAEMTAQLQAGEMTSKDWQDQFEILLARYHSASMAAGAKTKELNKAMVTKVIEYIAEQFGFLEDFAVEIQGAKEWQAGWNNRAESYAGAIKAPYWSGAVKMLPLPAMPGDGTTQCLGNCKCSWDVKTINEKRGDYDATWVYGETEDHCQSCKVRSNEWKPLKIRGGKVI